MSLSKFVPSGAEPEQKSPILTLISDCLDEIFDYLQLRDICAIGQTCKRLHRMAGAYFCHNYPLEQVYIENIRRTIRFQFETNFAPYARQIVICEEKGLSYAAKITYRNLDKVVFAYCRTFHTDHILHLIKMNVWKKILTLEFHFCSRAFRNNTLDYILKFCTNLQCLIFRYENGNVELKYESDWISQTIPKLSKLEISDSLSTNELKSVLLANPHIKQLSLEKNLNLLKAILEINISLDALEYSSYGEINQIVQNQLIALTEQGKYKSLFVKCNIDDFEASLERLKNANFLTSLKVFDLNLDECRFTKNLALIFITLSNLRKLEIPYIKLSNQDADAVTKSLKNLEEFHLTNGSVEQSLPFAQQLPKLRMIVAAKKSSQFIDLIALNNDRMKLPVAEKLTIYLRDEAFEQIRWTSLELFHEFVEVRRVVYANKRQRLKN